MQIKRAEKKRGGVDSLAKQSGEVAALELNGGAIPMDGDGDGVADEVRTTTAISSA
jgi:hypothetical protein